MRVREDGYVMLDNILTQFDELGRPLFTIQLIESIVANDPKRRFGILTEHGKRYIRVHQGHHLDLSLQGKGFERDLGYIITSALLTRIHDPSLYPVVCHSSFSKHFDSIIQEGLSKQRRMHIHMTAGDVSADDHDPDSEISGRRKTSDILVYVDIKRAFEDGIDFWRSENGVILTEGRDGYLPARYLTKIVSIDPDSPGKILWTADTNDPVHTTLKARARPFKPARADLGGQKCWKNELTSLRSGAQVYKPPHVRRREQGIHTD